MTEKATEILSHIESEVARSKWHFVSMIPVISRFGQCSDELNELYLAGKIARREGMNFDLIELTNGPK